MCSTRILEAFGFDLLHHQKLEVIIVTVLAGFPSPMSK